MRPDFNDKFAMTTLIVLFNLKPDADPKAYEAWAASTDLPTVRGLENCDSFELFRTSGLLGKSDPAPYQYIEQIVISDMPGFREETQTDTMKAVAAQFREFADSPIFMVSERVEA